MNDKIKFIKDLAASMNENKIDTVKYEDNNFEVQLIKREKEKRTVVYGGTPISGNITSKETVATPVSVKPKEIDVEISGTKIESPMVGTFYIAPSPTSPPFIKEGDSVTEGQTLCIVEAMKLMNEVKSSVSGKVKKILVKDGSTIKKGQALVIIE